MNNTICPICKRMLGTENVSEHHFIPKSKGGKEKTLLHNICHATIHSLFTNKELERKYSTPDQLLETPEIQKFVEWVKTKDPAFYVKHRESNKRKR